VKVLLVNAMLGRRQMPIYPLGLSCLASALEGHEVKVLDPAVLPRPLDEVERAARSFAPDVVGLSLRNIDPARSYDRLWQVVNSLDAIVGAGVGCEKPPARAR